MKVFVLVKFVDYEDSYIKGVVLTEKVASDWTQEQIQKFASKDFERLKRSKENLDEITIPTTEQLPHGYKYRNVGFIFEEFELDKVKES